MIFHTPELGPEELQVLKRIDGVIRNLSFGLSTPARWQGQLRRVTSAKAIRGSNTIEGYNVTVDDAIAAVEGEQPLEAGGETWAAVQGYRNAMTYVQQLAGDPYFRYSEDLVKSLHFMMLEYDLSKQPARWKSKESSVVSETTGEVVYVPPPFQEAPALMGELVQSLNNDDESHGMIRGAMAHLNLTMIHPFLDGNGRMARCLQSLVIARTGFLAPPFCSIEEYLGKNTNDYYQVLALVGQGKWNPGGNALPWIRFCLKAHYRQAATLLRRFRKLGEMWGELEQELQRRGLPDRMIYALADAALGFKVRNALYRRNADINPTLASRDLTMLVQQGLLLPHGERRGRFYVASPEIRALGTVDVETKRIPDPFEALKSGDTPMLSGF